MHNKYISSIAREISSVGYAVLNEHGPSSFMVKKARHLINRAFIEEGLSPATREWNERHTFFPQLVEHEHLTRLFDAVKPTVSALMGLSDPDDLNGASVSAPQIALRFPEPIPRPLAPHIDGNPTGGAWKPSFTMLVGIYLEEVRCYDGGPLHVWPGSHRTLVRHLAKDGPQRLIHSGELPALDHGKAVQVYGHSGAVILMHPMLLHSSGPNTSPDIRYALFARMKHPDFMSFGLAPTTKLWMGWDSMFDELEKEIP